MAVRRLCGRSPAFDFLFQLLDAVSDCMAFGALEKCPECKEGQLVYRSVSIFRYIICKHTYGKCPHCK